MKPTIDDIIDKYKNAKSVQLQDCEIEAIKNYYFQRHGKRIKSCIFVILGYLADLIKERTIKQGT